MDDNIVLVCHCKSHLPVYHVRTGEPVGEGIIYIDPKCPESTWEDIGDNSKDYVWGISCPVHLQIHYGKLSPDSSPNIFFDILNKSWRVLKEGGKVVFPSSWEDKIGERESNYYTQFDTTKKIANQWVFSLENSEDFPIWLGRQSSDTNTSIIKNPKLAVFTKPVSARGGVRNIKRRKTNRRRYKNRRVSTKNRRNKI